ncbi:MAG: bifunctional rhamnulose-1-phosphate aldolase/short-chain dehydrogenase [Chloroflexota bacterium]
MVKSLWNEAAPSEDEPLKLVAYRSRLLGADPDLVLWGGGNTSVKMHQRDHLGNIRRVLRIKGSGTDLKTIDEAGFPGVFLDDVLPLHVRQAMSDEEMVEYLGHCLVEPNGRRPSIETLLHAFLPARHIDHTHADAILALTNTDMGRQAVGEALGDDVAYLPWRRPGFTLAREVAALRDAEAVVLGNHGLVTWGDTAEESYRKTIELVDRAERWLNARTVAPVIGLAVPGPHIADLMPKLRRCLGHRILKTWNSDAYRALAVRADVEELAHASPATADHVLRVRPWPCMLRSSGPEAEIAEYAQRYRRFFDEHTDGSFPMLDPLPKVFIVPGSGLITAGRNEQDARITAEIALHTLGVAARALDVHGDYRSLMGKDLFDIEYWPLELYKLTLAPAPRELEGRIAVVTGAASGIGRAIARKLAGLGAYVMLLDLDSAGLDETAGFIRASPHDACETLACDVSDETSVEAVIHRVVELAGGIDALVSNAGVAAAGNLVDIDPKLWRRSMEVNATSHFLMTSAVMRVMKEQGLGGSLVFIASKNAFGPGAGFGAYSAAKAAQVQLARIAALEGGQYAIRSNAINPDAVFQDSKLWSPEVRQQRADAHGVPVEEIEEFYAERNLLKTRVTSDDVAEAAAFLISDRSRATTGAVIAVDGGVAAAFPR